MFTVEGGKLKSSGELMLVIFLCLGTFAGEIFRLDDRFTKFCNGIEKKIQSKQFRFGLHQQHRSFLHRCNVDSRLNQ